MVIGRMAKLGIGFSDHGFEVLQWIRERDGRTIFADLLSTSWATNRIVFQDYGPPSTAVESVFWPTSLSMRRMFPSRLLALHHLLQGQRPSNAVRKSTYPSFLLPWSPYNTVAISSVRSPSCEIRRGDSLCADIFACLCWLWLFWFG